MTQLFCPICNKQKIIFVYKKIFLTKSLLRCGNCGLYFVWPKSTSERNNNIYNQAYYRSWALEELKLEGLNSMKHLSFIRLFATLERYATKGRLLDIGCAFGSLLEVARDRGWDYYGVELSEYAADIAKERLGKDRIFVGNFLDFTFPVDSFEVITMLDVIEHTYDINAILNKCKNLLKPTGILAVVTPNIDDISHRYLKKYWLHFKEEHPIYLSQKYVNRILNLNNFKLVRVSNFNKAINFYYLRAQIKEYCKSFLVPCIDIVNLFLPKSIKAINFFIPQAEMLIIAQPQ